MYRVEYFCNKDTIRLAVDTYHMGLTQDIEALSSNPNLSGFSARTSVMPENTIAGDLTQNIVRHPN